MRAGWTHCVACTSSGAVYTWGRADYGQLGPGEEAEEPMLGREEGSHGEEEECIQTKNKEKYR